MNSLRRYLRKARDKLATRFFDTRFGRKILVHGIGARTLSMTVDCGDHIMTFSPGDYIGRKIFRKGHYDRDHVTRLLVILRERGLSMDGKVLLELGGNIGTHTVYFALSRTFSHIVSVEPDPRNIKLLQTNILQNGIETGITAVNCAAGEVEGEIEFFQNQSNHGRSGMSRRSPADVSITVPVKPVTRILEEAGVSIDDIGLVWMDIEGYEPVVMRSMRSLLERRIPVYTEFTPELYGPEEAARFVESIAEFYEDCRVFLEDTHMQMKVRDIPIKERQFDVLLLP
ncbi:FkbM family methyltransferase [Rhizobium sp. KVB221]|uniref:FkbM family methyltransferase n=2 Tax=Rhizobium setariae TaxID=2801340 RepID=A0A936YN68_9HYPH|nr:FkbM family methyltransferase [Rhizobium setariae]MBL0373634.1 FkbM family methyltransferase [Rhizobium setariae]